MKSIYPKSDFRDRLFSDIDHYLEVLGWNQNASREYLSDHFNSRTSRHQLNDDELRSLDHKLDWLSTHIPKSNAANQPHTTTADPNQIAH
jgi:hypothetical protein